MMWPPDSLYRHGLVCDVSKLCEATPVLSSVDSHKLLPGSTCRSNNSVLITTNAFRAIRFSSSSSGCCVKYWTFSSTCKLYDALLHYMLLHPSGCLLACMTPEKAYHTITLTIQCLSSVAVSGIWLPTAVML